jgi:integrase
MGRPKLGWKLRWRPGRPASVRFTVNGQQVDLGTGEYDEERAASKAAELYADAVRGARSVVRRSSARGKSFKAVALEWLSDVAPELGVRTRGTFALYAETHWSAHWETLEAVSSASAADYLRKRLRIVRATTVRKELSALRRMLAWCVETGRLHEAPTLPTVSRRALGTAHKQGRKGPPVEATPAEIERLIKKLPAKGRGGYPIRARFVVAYETGLRPTTIEGLSVPEHWKHGAWELRIPPELDKSRNGRPLPLTARARQALASAAPKKGVIFGVKDLRDSITKAAIAVLKEERGRRFAGHYFRHNRITHLAESTNNLAGVMYLVGHKRPDTTARYLKPSLRAAEEVLGAAKKARRK